MRAEKGAIDENLSTHLSYLLAAGKLQLDTLAFPEASLSGYINPGKFPRAVLTSESTVVEELIDATSRSNVTILPGIIEQNPEENPFVTQLAIKNGTFVGKCRKRTNIFDSDPERYASGNEAVLFEAANLKFGISICADIGNQQVFTELSDKGADAIFELAAPGLHGQQAGRDWQSGSEWWRTECFNL